MIGFLFFDRMIKHVGSDTLSDLHASTEIMNMRVDKSIVGEHWENDACV